MDAYYQFNAGKMNDNGRHKNIKMLWCKFVKGYTTVDFR